MIKIKNEVCTKCDMEIKLPDYDETRAVSEYFPKWEREVLRHGWHHHHEDFPPQFKTFAKFMKWSVTPEGKAWNRLQGHWRNKILNGFVTQYVRKKDEHF